MILNSKRDLAWLMGKWSQWDKLNMRKSSFTSERNYGNFQKACSYFLTQNYNWTEDYNLYINLYISNTKTSIVL